MRAINPMVSVSALQLPVSSKGWLWPVLLKHSFSSVFGHFRKNISQFKQCFKFTHLAENNRIDESTEFFKQAESDVSPGWILRLLNVRLLLTSSHRFQNYQICERALIAIIASQKPSRTPLRRLQRCTKPLNLYTLEFLRFHGNRIE
jgi:hypothetical protein